MRMTVLQFVFAVSFAVVVHAEALHIGGDKQVFAGPWGDDGRDVHLVESMKNISMTMNPARVTGEELLVQDKPWEGTGILDMRQCVIRDGNRFRMYYSALPHHFVVDDPEKKQYGNLWKKPYQRILCYAESEDGIHWKKPDLGLCEWEGSRENNILFPNDAFDYQFSEMEGACVFFDPVAKSSDEKYKMFCKISPVGKGGTERKGPIPVAGSKALKKGQYAFASPDGIRWRLLSEKQANLGANDTQFSVFCDDRIDRYVQYTRVVRPNEEQASHYRKVYGGYKGRTTDLMVGRSQSNDFLHWTGEKVVLAPDAIDRAGAPKGVTPMDFYGGNISKYTEAPDVYIGLPNAYYHWKFDMNRRWWTGKYVQLPSTLDVQLVTSRDGITWNRAPQRKPFIRLGPKGSWWSGSLWPDGNCFRVGDELWFFFAGLSVSHKEQSLIKSTGARGRAVLRLDGFVSADAAYTGGELTTVPIVFEGDALQLNVDTSAGGVVRVELLDIQGNAIPAFTAADSEEVNGNYIRHIVTWNGQSDVSALAGKSVRLRFRMRDAKLYSFQFVKASDGQ